MKLRGWIVLIALGVLIAIVAVLGIQIDLALYRIVGTICFVAVAIQLATQWLLERRHESVRWARPLEFFGSVVAAVFGMFLSVLTVYQLWQLFGVAGWAGWAAAVATLAILGMCAFGILHMIDILRGRTSADDYPVTDDPTDQ